MLVRGAVRAGLIGMALAFAASVPSGGPASAQQATVAVPPQILTLDQERLFSETLYGKRLVSEVERVSEELAQRNRDVSAELAAEEKDLTEQRKQMTLQQFRPLADAFDEKVVRLRKEQDDKIVALQRQRDQERHAFSVRILPILRDIVAEVGGLAILDERAVILASDQIDITDRAIAQIDERLGDGAQFGPAEAEDTGPADAPAPDGSGIGAGAAGNAGTQPGSGNTPLAVPDPGVARP
ncbi:OmpH family outer membrane protein [Tropicimonas sp. IMCC34043]|uniref:OmpH family outer membrane protein n=1 Tax=Tropicimonas sp. IMCC34043 TaxID=2248760 RepID=UPI000E26B352|nr:OmpH family outer membrane protein [Tropicimonas sp. IMCC34043]